MVKLALFSPEQKYQLLAKLALLCPKQRDQLLVKLALFLEQRDQLFGEASLVSLKFFSEIYRVTSESGVIILLVFCFSRDEQKISAGV